MKRSYYQLTRIFLQTYKVIFELEEAKHIIEMTREEQEVQNAKNLAAVRSEYEEKIQDLSLELIKKNGKFEEFRSTLHNVSLTKSNPTMLCNSQSIVNKKRKCEFKCTIFKRVPWKKLLKRGQCQCKSKAN